MNIASYNNYIHTENISDPNQCLTNSRLTFSLCIVVHMYFLQYMYSTESIHASGRDGLRLTLLDVQLNHSGVYSCTASNKFERVKATVRLNVWPYGTQVQFLRYKRRFMYVINTARSKLLFFLAKSNSVFFLPLFPILHLPHSPLPTSSLLLFLPLPFPLLITPFRIHSSPCHLKSTCT